MVEQSPRFEELKIRLPEPISGVEEVSAVLGIPEWWPTGPRVAVVIAHGSAGNMDDPVVSDLHRRLTERKFLTLRFNFPFGEAGKRSGTDSAEAMERTFRAAMSILARDSTQAPAQVIVGGKGTGAGVAAKLAAGRGRIGGLFFLGFPLHPQDRKEKVRAEHLFRITSPMLFIQGTRDRRCDVDTLRSTIRGIGASSQLHVVEEADQNFKVTKRSLRNEADIRDETFDVLHDWLGKVIGEV
ncbi:MAG: alpha/beta family hydrolase [Myxococcota bacterium]|nr:alpha/beta family hydrolase [Myxococcota bacterium]